MNPIRPALSASPGHIAAAVVGAFIVGILLGTGGTLVIVEERGSGRSSPSPAVLPSRSDEAQARISAAGLTTLETPGVLDPLIELQRIRALNFSDEKQAALLALASQAPLGQIPALLDSAAVDRLLSGARVVFLEKLLARWAQTNPTEALAWTRRHGSAAERGRLAESVFKAWAQREPHAAAEHAVNEGSLFRPDLLHAVLETWGRSSPHEAQQWLASKPPSPLQVDLQRRFLRSLVATDPIAAADFASAGSLDGALEEIVARWAATDAVAAVAWALYLPEGPARETALGALAEAWTQIDLPGATVYANTLPDPDQRSVFAQAAARQLAARDPHAALAWAQALPDPTDRERALYATLSHWAERAPGDAARYLAGIQETDSVAMDALSPVVTQWTAKDPAAVADWVATLPNDTFRKHAVETFALQWASVDPQALDAWLHRLPPGPLRDHAADAGSSRVQDSNPALAAGWAVGIGNAALQKQSLESLFEQWRGNDARAARAWLEHSGLAPDLKADLFRRLGDHR